MKEPVLKKKRQNKKFHGYNLIDYYSWVHQDNILGVLSNPLLLDKEVREYLEKENKYASDIRLDAMCNYYSFNAVLVVISQTYFY